MAKAACNLKAETPMVYWRGPTRLGRAGNARIVVLGDKRELSPKSGPDPYQNSPRGRNEQQRRRLCFDTLKPEIQLQNEVQRFFKPPILFQISAFFKLFRTRLRIGSEKYR